MLLVDDSVFPQKRRIFILNLNTGYVKKANPLVSVIVPSYNHERYITKCIISITSQSYSNIELIVIDDGSTDSSAMILSDLCARAGFTFITQQNQGHVRTLNYAIDSLARGKYVAVCASDDFFAEEKIEKQVRFLEENPQYGMCFGKAYAVDSNDNIINKDLNMDLRGGNIFEDLMLMKFHPPVNYLYRRDILINTGLFDENIHTEDYYMNLKIAEIYPIGFIDEFISYYRIHSYSNLQVVKQYLSHLMAIEHFKHSSCFNDALSCWHWRVLGVFPKFTQLKIRSIKSFRVHWESLFSLHYFKAIFKLVFIWEKL